MKYYSEQLHKLYDSAEELGQAEKDAAVAEMKAKAAREKAEAEAKAKREAIAAERKSKATEVEEARKAMLTAQSKYKEVLEAFCKQYGTWHTSISSSEIPTLFDFFNLF